MSRERGFPRELRQALLESGLFDARWYEETYRDVPSSGLDPLTHFIRFGALMQRRPGPLFDPRHYLAQNPDVVRAGMNALEHFIRHGRAEGRAGIPPAGPDRDAERPPQADERAAPAWRTAVDAFALRGLAPCAPLAVVVNAPTPAGWWELLALLGAQDAVGFDLFVLGAVDALDIVDPPRAARSFTHLGAADPAGEARRFAWFASSGAADAYEALLWLSPAEGATAGEIDRAVALAPVLLADPDWGCVGAEILPLSALGDDALRSTTRTALARLGLRLRGEPARAATGAAVWLRPLLLRGLGPALRPFERDAAFAGRPVALAVLAQLAAEGAFGLRSLADDTRAAPAAAARSVKAIAFYLPQFHPIPENDAWWGRGFTEWSNVTRGKPLFRYHNQPRVPADLGYYDLRLEDTQVAQAELAREYGIHGFCYYYYWFNGRKLLNQPIENMLRSSRIDAGFCICWANENWSRNWDGQNRHVLMRQEYSVEGNVALIHEIIPMMKDPRWIRHRGRPVMIVYRISIIPDWPETARRWREACRKAGLGEIHLCAVRFGLETLQGRPEDHGLDAYVLFPPHEAAREDLRGEVLDLHRDFRGEIFHYPAVVDGDLSRYEPGYDWPIHRGAMLAWDNTARRLTDARVFHGATPYGFRRWMKGLLEQEGRHAPHGESLVFINAWNEWAEGTYLEPDQRWGRANLAAFRSAVAATPGATAVTPPRGVAAAPKLAARLREAGDPVDAEGNGPGHPVWRPGRRAHAPDRPTVMLCAHIAGHHLFGAERSLLDLATAFVEVGANLIVTLPSGGNVRYLEEIDRLCVGAYVFAYPQWMQDRPPQGWLTTTFADIIARHRVDAVHVNTIVLLEPAEAARRMGVPAVVHVRELISLDEPLRRAIGLETGDIVARVLARADWLMCNSRCTRTLFSKGERTLYAPNAVQLGLSENKFGSTIKFGIVSSNLPKKGVADFVEVARRAAERAPRARFVVVGPENDLTAAWAEEVRRGERPDNLRFLGYRDTPRAAMVELNVLLNLSLFGESFGRTVAEAMACGRPVIAYDWGALPELVRHGETGLLTPFRDIEAVVKAVETFCGHDELITRMGREAQAVVTRDFAQAALNRAMVDGYRRIIGDARPKGAAAPAPTIPRTTVVIAAYNAPEALRACLASVLKHTDMAANRVLVIDDASPDPAVGAVLAAFEGAPGLTVRRNADNLGYTRTVNLGLAEAGADDVVLLNADTLATPRWLEGLRAAAYCRPQVATVTAMSDNAGAFSFPDFDAPCPKPDHLSHEEYAILMTQATQGCAPPETPTGSGFCMYMRRAAVEAVGVFDADAFPRGYGEENDLCMRMLKAGWINLVSPWSFVYHVRSASFGSGKAALVKAGVDVVTGRYPDYAARVREAFAAPAMTALREAARRARTGSWEWEA